MKRIVIGLCALTALQAQGEQVYVSDKLVVGVYPEMTSETAKIANLETGDAVEVIERADRYIKVKLSDDREGWVRASYLTAQPPAIVRLRELQGAAATPSTMDAGKAELGKEVAALKQQNTALQDELSALKQSMAAMMTNSAPSQPLSATSEVAVQTIAPTTLPRWWAMPLAILVAGLFGFAFGYRTMSAKIRKKYGNLKVI